MVLILRHVRKEAEPRFTISESSPDGTHRSNHSVARCKSSLAEHTCNKQKKNVSIQDGPNGTIGCPQVEHHNRRKPYLNPVVGPPPPFGRTPQQLLFPVLGSETSGSETDSDTSPNEEPALPLWTHAACNCRPHLRLFLCIAGKPPVYETVLFDFFLEMEESDTCCYRCRRSTDTGLRLSNRCWTSADTGLGSSNRCWRSADTGLYLSNRCWRSADTGPYSSNRGWRSADTGLYSSNRCWRSADTGLCSLNRCC